MKHFLFIKKPVYSALVFFGTLLVLSAGYATYNALSEVDTGDSLTKDIWNQMVRNISDLDSRVSGITSSLATLQASAWNLWGPASGGIAYTWGNVGIGTDSPSYTFDVAGTVNATAFRGDGSALTGLPGGIPTGMVMAYNGTVCPSGWKEANGTAVPVGTGGSSTLNLRGEFVRGLDNGRNIDIGRTIATHQSGTDISIYTDNNGYVFWRNTDGSVTYSNHNIGSVNVASTNGASSFIVRPRNVALLYCVKQ